MAKKRKVTEHEESELKETESQDLLPGPSKIPAPSKSKESPPLVVVHSLTVDKESPKSSPSQDKGSLSDPVPSTSHQDHDVADDVWMDQSSEEDDPPRMKSKV